MSYSKKKISAQIIADSINTHGNRVTTLLVTFPRFILAELNTHRMFSKNSASSRAIPFEKMVKMVEEDPFIPIAWQKSHSGMQGNEYFIDFQDIEDLEREWLFARDEAVNSAISMNSRNCTKQLLNRLLEPFMWHTVLVTSTEWENFFNLRCPKYQTPVSQTIEPQYSWKDLIENHSNPINLDKLEKNQDNWAFKMQHSLSGAEIHMQALAEAMWDAMNESTPKELKDGEWHVPFGDKIDSGKLYDYIYNNKIVQYDRRKEKPEINKLKLKISSARCARLSYMTFDGEINYEKDIQLHDTLLKSGHMSPFEHCCKVMSDLEYKTFVKGKLNDQGCELNNYETGYSQDVWIGNEIQGWCDNFRGFISYRHLLNEGN